MSEELQAGMRFRHYKGGDYVIVGVGTIEADLTPCVIYRSTNEDQAWNLWVRPRESFDAMIIYGGRLWPRFARMRLGDCDCGSIDFSYGHNDGCASKRWIVDDPRMPAVSAL